MNGLYVLRKVEKSMIRADQDALDKYEKRRLRKEVNFFKSSDISNEIPNTLLLLLNTEGMFKTHEKFMENGRFQAVLLIFLTETHTSSESDLLPMHQNYHCHTFLVHNNTNKCKSLVLLFNCDLFDCINFLEYNVLICTTVNSKTSELCLTVVLLYRGKCSELNKLYAA